jgi:hypothetical protein
LGQIHTFALTHAGARAFRAYADARAKRSIAQAAATVRFMVKSVNKDGSISRMAPTRNDWKYDAFATAEDAEKRRDQFEAMEPRLALRGGRALTRATGRRRWPTWPGPQRAPREGPRARPGATWARPIVV